MKEASDTAGVAPTIFFWPKTHTIAVNPQDGTTDPELVPDDRGHDLAACMAYNPSRKQFITACGDTHGIYAHLWSSVDGDHVRSARIDQALVLLKARKRLSAIHTSLHGEPAGAGALSTSSITRPPRIPTTELKCTLSHGLGLVFFTLPGTPNILVYTTSLRLLAAHHTRLTDVTCLACDGAQVLVSGHCDGTLAVWDTDKTIEGALPRVTMKLRQSTPFETQYHPITTLVYDTSMHRVIGTLASSIVVWSAVTGEIIFRVNRVHDRPITALTYDHRTHTLATGCTSGRIKVFTLGNNECRPIAHLKGQSAATHSLAFLGEDRLMACGLDGRIRLHAVSSKTELDAFSFDRGVIPLCAMIVSKVTHAGRSDKVPTVFVCSIDGSNNQQLDTLEISQRSSVLTILRHRISHTCMKPVVLGATGDPGLAVLTHSRSSGRHSLTFVDSNTGAVMTSKDTSPKYMFNNPVDSLADLGLQPNTETRAVFLDFLPALGAVVIGWNTGELSFSWPGTSIQPLTVVCDCPTSELSSIVLMPSKLGLQSNRNADKPFKVSERAVANELYRKCIVYGQVDGTVGKTAFYADSETMTIFQALGPVACLQRVSPTPLKPGSHSGRGGYERLIILCSSGEISIVLWAESCPALSTVLASGNITAWTPVLRNDTFVLGLSHGLVEFWEVSSDMSKQVTSPYQVHRCHKRGITALAVLVSDPVIVMGTCSEDYTTRVWTWKGDQIELIYGITTMRVSRCLNIAAQGHARLLCSMRNLIICLRLPALGKTKIEEGKPRNSQGVKLLITDSRKGTDLDNSGIGNNAIYYDGQVPDATTGSTHSVTTFYDSPTKGKKTKDTEKHVLATSTVQMALETAIPSAPKGLPERLRSELERRTSQQSPIKTEELSVMSLQKPLSTVNVEIPEISMKVSVPLPIQDLLTRPGDRSGSLPTGPADSQKTALVSNYGLDSIPSVQPHDPSLPPSKPLKDEHPAKSEGAEFGPFKHFVPPTSPRIPVINPTLEHGVSPMVRATGEAGSPVTPPPSTVTGTAPEDHSHAVPAPLHVHDADPDTVTSPNVLTPAPSIQRALRPNKSSLLSLHRYRGWSTASSTQEDGLASLAHRSQDLDLYGALTGNPVSSPRPLPPIDSTGAAGSRDRLNETLKELGITQDPLESKYVPSVNEAEFHGAEAVPPRFHLEHKKLSYPILNKERLRSLQTIPPTSEDGLLAEALRHQIKPQNTLLPAMAPGFALKPDPPVHPSDGEFSLDVVEARGLTPPTDTIAMALPDRGGVYGRDPIITPVFESERPVPRIESQPDTRIEVHGNDNPEVNTQPLQHPIIKGALYAPHLQSNNADSNLAPPRAVHSSFQPRKRIGPRKLKLGGVDTDVDTRYPERRKGRVPPVSRATPCKTPVKLEDRTSDLMQSPVMLAKASKKHRRKLIMEQLEEVNRINVPLPTISDPVAASVSEITDSPHDTVNQTVDLVAYSQDVSNPTWLSSIKTDDTLFKAMDRIKKFRKRHHRRKRGPDPPGPDSQDISNPGIMDDGRNYFEWVFMSSSSSDSSDDASAASSASGKGDGWHRESVLPQRVWRFEDIPEEVQLETRASRKGLAPHKTKKLHDKFRPYAPFTQPLIDKDRPPRPPRLRPNPLATHQHLPGSFEEEVTRVGHLLQGRVADEHAVRERLRRVHGRVLGRSLSESALDARTMDSSTYHRIHPSCIKDHVALPRAPTLKCEFEGHIDASDDDDDARRLVIVRRHSVAGARDLSRRFGQLSVIAHIALQRDQAALDEMVDRVKSSKSLDREPSRGMKENVSGLSIIIQQEKEARSSKGRKTSDAPWVSYYSSDVPENQVAESLSRELWDQPPMDGGVPIAKNSPAMRMLGEMHALGKASGIGGSSPSMDLLLSPSRPMSTDSHLLASGEFAIVVASDDEKDETSGSHRLFTPGTPQYHLATTPEGRFGPASRGSILSMNSEDIPESSSHFLDLLATHSSITMGEEVPEEISIDASRDHQVSHGADDAVYVPGDDDPIPNPTLEQGLVGAKVTGKSAAPKAKKKKKKRKLNKKEQRQALREEKLAEIAALRKQRERLEFTRDFNRPRATSASRMEEVVEQLYPDILRPMRTRNSVDAYTYGPPSIQTMVLINDLPLARDKPPTPTPAKVFILAPEPEPGPKQEAEDAKSEDSERDLATMFKMMDWEDAPDTESEKSSSIDEEEREANERVKAELELARLRKERATNNWKLVKTRIRDIIAYGLATEKHEFTDLTGDESEEEVSRWIDQMIQVYELKYRSQYGSGQRHLDRWYFLARSLLKLDIAEDEVRQEFQERREAILARLVAKDQDSAFRIAANLAARELQSKLLERKQKWDEHERLQLEQRREEESMRALQFLMSKRAIAPDKFRRGGSTADLMNKMKHLSSTGKGLSLGDLLGIVDEMEEEDASSSSSLPSSGTSCHDSPELAPVSQHDLHLLQALGSLLDDDSDDDVLPHPSGAEWPIEKMDIDEFHLPQESRYQVRGEEEDEAESNASSEDRRLKALLGSDDEEGDKLLEELERDISDRQHEMIVFGQDEEDFQLMYRLRKEEEARESEARILAELAAEQQREEERQARRARRRYGSTKER